MDNYYSFCHDASEEQYVATVHYLLQHSDAFQVVLSNHRIRSKLPASSRRFKEMLKHDRVGGWSKTGDYSLPLTEGTTAPGKYCTTAMFQVSEDSFSLVEQPMSFWNWMLPDYPEDLSFYRNGFCWFATCSHEQIIWFCAEREIAEKIISLSGIPFEKNGYCDENELFHEKYKLRKTSIVMESARDGENIGVLKIDS